MKFSETLPDSLLTTASRCLLGTALGDAMGLPMEGLSPRRAVKLFGSAPGLRLLPGRGMVSDDTKHACMTAQALIASAGEPERFVRELAMRLRWWIAALPAGVGKATLISGLRLWVGVHPERSGVRSAGNGPCMRAPIIGVFARSDAELVDLARRSAVLTHRDDRAVDGAIAIALAAHHNARGMMDSERFVAHTKELLPNSSEIAIAVSEACRSAATGEPLSAFASRIGCPQGVSGFVMHTVPVAVHAWLSRPRNLVAAIRSVITCGGDTDSVAAIVGGIVGAAPGIEPPRELLERIVGWPRGTGWMNRVGAMLEIVGADRRALPPPRVLFPAAVARNVVFGAIVFSHGLRRLAPPY